VPRFTVERIGPDQLREQLASLEQEHNMTSAEFLDRWTQGELDSPGFVFWAGLCRMAVRAGILESPKSLPSAFPGTSSGPNVASSVAE
jgi:hypothetical protein